MVKLQFDKNSQYKITLPKALIEAIGWRKGDGLRIVLDSHGNVVVKRGEGK